MTFLMPQFSDFYNFFFQTLWKLDSVLIRNEKNMHFYIILPNLYRHFLPDLAIYLLKGGEILLQLKLQNELTTLLDIRKSSLAGAGGKQPSYASLSGSYSIHWSVVAVN